MSTTVFLRRIESKLQMNKRQLIEEIQQLNRSAQAAFLEQFCEKDLQEYLTYLRGAYAKRVRVNAFPEPEARRLAG
jgi:hypothetical protein